MLAGFITALVTSPLVALAAAQVTGGPGDVTSTLVTAIAGSSPFAGLAMYVIVSTRADVKQALNDKNELITTMMDKVVPAQIESNRLHGEVVKTLETTAIMVHNVAGRSFDPVTQSEILRQLRRLDGR